MIKNHLDLHLGATENDMQAVLTYTGQPSPVETVKSVRKAHSTLS